jgi:glutathione reductase (NADPH)
LIVRRERLPVLASTRLIEGGGEASDGDMNSPYDLLIIGTGTAASVVSSAVREAGWRVAVVDHRPFGGTCALRGCDPKKVLVGAANAADHARRMRGKGLAGDARIEWPPLITFKRSFTDPVPGDRAQGYAKKGIDAFSGRARFVTPAAVEVDGRRLEARHFLIATGAEPVELDIPGEEHLVTSDEFLEMRAMPRRMAVVGGGYIAAEFSSVAAVAGADVTVLQRGERMLAHFDPDLVSWLTDSFAARGIEVRTGSNVEAVEQHGTGYEVLVAAAGKNHRIAADLVLHAAGRRPALADLDLEAAGVDCTDGRLSLNEFLQSTSNPAVYAAGDAARAGPPLTPVASHDARVVAANLLEGNHTAPDYSGVPSVAFSIPPIAAVGMDEQAAKERGGKVRVNCRKAPEWYTARQQAQPAYGFKVLVDDETDRVLGAHLLGPHADEVINLFALAIRRGLTAEDLRTTMFAYPTGASDLSSML